MFSFFLLSSHILHTVYSSVVVADALDFSLLLLLSHILLAFVAVDALDEVFGVFLLSKVRVADDGSGGNVLRVGLAVGSYREMMVSRS